MMSFMRSTMHGRKHDNNIKQRCEMRQTKESVRREQLFTGWKFKLQEDKGWRDVKVPHDWSTEYPVCEEEPTCGSGGYVHAGVGLYQREFQVEPEKDEHIWFYFEGIYMSSTVYINGEKAGSHFYGYTPFEIDATPYLREGNNTLLVIVDNSEQPNSRWYSGSGITRNVWLEYRKAVHFAKFGIYAKTGWQDSGKGNLFLSAVVQKEEKTGEEALEYHYCLLQEQGRIVATGRQALEEEWKLPGDDSGVMDARNGELPKNLREKKTELYLELESVSAWTPETPVLYTLESRLINEKGEILDEQIVKIGFRSIAFDPDHGFLLNRNSYKVKGVCLHHDGGCVGAAVPHEVWERRLKKLKDMGINAIRCSHNPPDEGFLNLCDRMGFLVMDEMFDEWEFTKNKEVGSNTHESKGYSRNFWEQYRYDSRVMLYRDRNHPSIFIWSIGNEIPEQTMENGEQLAEELVQECHRIDPGRYAVLALDQIQAEPWKARDAFIDKLDVVGYNYVGRWRKRAETFYDDDRHAYPGRCVIGTENPSAGYERGTYRFTNDTDSFWDKPYYTAAVSVGKLLRYTMTHDFVAGDFMWTGIDYLGESGWPLRAAGCGCLDTCGFEKDAFYFYKSVYRPEEKFAYLCPHWNLELPVGCVIPVICYTSCETAELFVNGQSYGKKTKHFPCYGMTEHYGHFDRIRRPANTDDLFLSWDVPYEPGKISVVGYEGEQAVCTYEVETTSQAVAIRLFCDQTELYADGKAVAQIEVSIVDEKGRLVPDADCCLNYRITENAEILGIDNGRLDCHDKWKEPDNRSTFHGRSYCIVRSENKKGKIRLEVDGGSLGKADLMLTAK